jgi:EAL domain-containing protein (putative c-di-GMP-specific phosphodiesterase class I)
MDLGDLQLSNNILIHPSMSRRLASVSSDQVFVIEIRNYPMIVEAFGLEVAYDAFATLLARVRGALGSAGVATPDGEARLGVIFWGVPIHGSDWLGYGASDWPEALIRDIVLEPVFTAAGAVHLNAAVINLDRTAMSERHSNNGSDPAARDAVKPSAVEAARRTYRSDMAVLSPVLAAIGGFREAEQIGPKGDVIDVDIAWRPIGRAAAPGGSVFYQASLALIRADGQLASCEQVMAASERVGLVHLLDEYIVSSAADELIEARGAVSLLVSVSGESLSDRQFWRGILEKLERGGGAACDLIVEVRGSSLVCAAPGMNDTLAMLRRQGCRISFGNFGLGATSLRDLVAFTPDFVTIDRHFLSQTLRTQFGGEPLLHLVALAHALGAEVIVDGVDCINLAGVAHESGAALQKGAWCGGQRFFRSWAKRTAHDTQDELP